MLIYVAPFCQDQHTTALDSLLQAIFCTSESPKQSWGRYAQVRHYVPCFLAKCKSSNRHGELLDTIPDLHVYRSKEIAELFSSKSLQNCMLACFFLWSLWVLEKGNKLSDLSWLIRIPHYHSVWKTCMKSLVLNKDKCVHNSTLVLPFSTSENGLLPSPVTQEVNKKAVFLFSFAVVTHKIITSNVSKIKECNS